MKKSTYTLNTLLAAVLGAVLLVCVLVRTFAPRIILPQLDVPNMVLISLAALLIDHLICGQAQRCYVCVPVFGGLTFGLLPFAACFVGLYDALKLAAMGAVVFTAVTWLFTSVQDRLSTGANAKAAPFISAFGIYLAAQCLMGMF